MYLNFFIYFLIFAGIIFLFVAWKNDLEFGLGAEIPPLFGGFIIFLALLIVSVISRSVFGHDAYFQNGSLRLVKLFSLLTISCFIGAVFEKSYRKRKNREIKNKAEETAYWNIPIEVKHSKPFTEQFCPYCQIPIKSEDSARLCPFCSNRYHAACWEKGRGCTNSGCQNNYSNIGSATPVLSNPQNSNQNEKTPPSIGVSFLKGTLTLAVVIFLLIWNSYYQANKQLNEILNSTPSKQGIFAWAYYRSFFDREIIMLDFKGITGNNVRRIDPIHMLMQFGEGIQPIKYQLVVLSNNGNNIFVITKSDLSELSNEYTHGNPIWSFNHLPEHLLFPDLQAAFSTWTGGWLGVAEKQTEDLNSATAQWLRIPVK